MLDEVYGLFDDRINFYDVYKVETIGDTYMVVSGLPQRNGMRHVDQIARIALDFVKAVDELNSPQLPTKRLSVRIGIHTGKSRRTVLGSRGSGATPHSRSHFYTFVIRGYRIRYIFG